MDNNYFTKLLLSKNKRGILIKGKYGVGKSWFIKEYFNNNDEMKKLEGKYKNVSIFNASDIDNLDIKKTVILKTTPLLLNERNEKTNKSMRMIKNSAGSLQDICSGVLKKFTGISLTTTITDVFNYYPIKDHLIIIDEIDRKSDDIKLKDILTRLINLQEKYDNIKIVCILNDEDMLDDDKKVFKDWGEKLFSKTIYYKNEDYSKNHFNFITDETWEFLNQYNINERNIRIYEIAEDLFEILDNDLKNIDENDLKNIKNDFFENIHLYFYDKKYIDTYIGNKKDELLKVTAEKFLLRNTKIISNFYDGDGTLLYEYINKVLNPEDIKPYVRDIEYFYNNKYNKLLSNKISIEEESLYILNNYNNELPITTKHNTVYSLIHWINLPFTYCNNVVNKKEFKNFLKDKIKNIDSNIKSLSFDGLKDIELQLNCLTVIQKSLDLNVQSMINELHGDIEILRNKIKINLKDKTKADYDKHLTDDEIIYILDNEIAEFIEHFFKKSKTDYTAIKLIKEKIHNKEKYITKISKFLTKNYNENLNVEYIIKIS